MVKHRSPKPRFRVRVAAGPPLFLRLLMHRVLATPAAMFLNLNLAFHQLAILPTPIVNPFTGLARQLD